MRYAKANSILPEDLVEMIQEYTDGCYLYIPQKKGKAKKWGEVCGNRGKVSQRNKLIYSKYCSGIKVPKLSEQYFLSERTILNIISSEKGNQNK